jgi:hypothetical protein
MQTLLPMVTISKLSIHTSSPIQEWLPIFNRHGYFMFTLGFITTPSPTFAPNNFNKKHFNLYEGNNDDLKNIPFTKNQTVCLKKLAPGLYQSLLNLLRSVLIYGIRGQR